MTSDTTAQLGSVISDITKQFQGLAEQMTQLGNSLQRLATAGLSATTEGNRLSFVWEKFTQQIASVFLPVIKYLIEKLVQLTVWFKGLTGDSQSLIMKIGLIAGAFLLITPILAALGSVLSPIAIAVAAVGFVLYEFFTKTEMGKAVLDSLSESVQWAITHWEDIREVMETVMGRLIKVFQTVAAGFMWFGLKLGGVIEEIISWIPGLGDMANAIKDFREKGEQNLALLLNDINAPIQVTPRGSKGDGRDRQQVNPTGFAFESLSASFERITSAANKQDIAKDSLAVQKQQLGWLEKIAQGIQDIDDRDSGGGDF